MDPSTAFSFLHGLDLFAIVCLILVFIFRTELRNMGSAVILFFSPKISVGDFVKIKDAKGKVLGIGFNVGIKNTEDNYMAYIPSSVVLRSKIINYTLGNGKNYYGDNEE